VLASFDDYKDNMYIKSVVVVRPFKGQKMYVSNAVQPVSDYNQITYHLLSVMLAHAQRTKGSLNKTDQSKTNFSTDKKPLNNSNLNVSLSAGQDHKSLIKSVIIQMCHSSNNAMVRKSELIQQVKHIVPEKQIEAFLKKLENDEEIYTGEGDPSDPYYGSLGN